MIEKVYCISLKDIDIRRKLMEDQLSKEFPDKYEICDAYTCNDEEVITSYNNLTLKNTNIEALSQIAICLSHINCLKKIYENKLTYGAIIEDDIRIKNNIQNRLEEYIKNSPNIIKSMENEPCLIHICGPYNYIQQINKFKERKDEIIINICFYVVNHMMAKILIDNFYPIKWQFDTYVSKIIREKNIKEYTACPILAWDLSSTLYSKYWTSSDIEVKKYISSTSKIIKINDMIMKPNVYIDDTIYFNKHIYNQIIQTYKHPEDSDIHHLSPNFNLMDVSNNTIVSGQGIKDLNDVIYESPYKILYVRGPLTRNKYIEFGIECPELYMDPLIIYSSLDNIKIGNRGLNIYGRNIIIVDYDLIVDNKIIKYVNINKVDPVNIVALIKNNDMIISNIYEILVISTSYNKKTIPINNEDNTCDIRYIDYMLGYKNVLENYDISKLNYYGIDDVINMIQSSIIISYPQINYEELKNKQKDLIKYTPYIY